MTFTWREHVEAVDEYQAAAEWYETTRPGWGDVFMDAVDAAINSILDPAIRRGFYRDLRSEPQVYTRSVTGFPFQVIYFLVEEEVLVVGYAHERRLPGCWVDRIDR